MATTETSKFHTLAGVIGVGSLAFFGATACEGGGAEPDEGGGENGEMEEESEETTEDDSEG